VSASATTKQLLRDDMQTAVIRRDAVGQSCCGRSKKYDSHNFSDCK